MRDKKQVSFKINNKVITLVQITIFYLQTSNTDVDLSLCSAIILIVHIRKGFTISMVLSDG